MLKSLYPTIDWQGVKAVGFDLDGTLYDEFDFISQVYQTIAQKIATATGTDHSSMYSFLLRRWLEKGSSYNRIFSDALSAGCVEPETADRVVGECLTFFRTFRPVLQLSARVITLLDVIAEQYPLFLVTDGSCVLQQAKIATLDLARWFRPENIVISGCLASRMEKPAIAALDHIAIFNGTVDPAAAVFFGDRAVDRLFADAAGFRFVGVKNMWAV